MRGFRAQSHVARVHTTHLLIDVGFSTLITVIRANVTTLTRLFHNVQIFFLSYSLFKDAKLTHEQTLKVLRSLNPQRHMHYRRYNHR